MTETCSENCAPLFEIVLNPTPNCNLSCAYCFDRWRDQKKIIKMEDDVFERVKRFVEFMGGDMITFAFLGGEATLLGVDYYQHFEDYFEDIPHHSHLQSNMTLLDDEFCAFFSKYNYTVGSSLDGTPKLHNSTRDNSFSESLRGITLAKEYDILAKVLCTITNDSIPYIEEIFELYALIGSPVHFNAGSPYLTPKNYHIAMQKLFEMWHDFGRPFYGIQFEKTLARIQNQGWHDGSNQAISGCMHGALQVDFNGTIVMCSQLAKYPEYQLGNILTTSPQDILSHPNRANFFQKNQDIRTRCQKCVYRWICSGGCYFNAHSHNLPYDPYCNGGAGMYKSAIERTGLSFKEYMELTK